jgi:hypothetical protein
MSIQPALHFDVVARDIRLGAADIDGVQLVRLRE